MEKDSKIYIAGHKGLVGSAIKRKLENLGYINIIFKSRQELDLMDSLSVAEFFSKEKPHYVFLAAAKVGGILANITYPAEFIFQNLTIQNNIIHNSYLNGVKKLLFLGSSCIYPKECPQPIKEEFFMTGSLEKTNEAYAVAKIAGIKMCQSYNKQYGTKFISVMPTNLYGPNDNFDLNTSHVLPAFIHKFHKAKKENAREVVMWGSGMPKREFLHVDDMAEACIFLMDNYNQDEIINIGTGDDISIMDLANLVKRIVGFKGEIVKDTSKPDGTLRKVLDVSRIKDLGWKPKIILEQGITETYKHFLSELNLKE